MNGDSEIAGNSPVAAEMKLKRINRRMIIGALHHPSPVDIGENHFGWFDDALLYRDPPTTAFQAFRGEGSSIPNLPVLVDDTLQNKAVTTSFRNFGQKMIPCQTLGSMKVLISIEECRPFKLIPKIPDEVDVCADGGLLGCIAPVTAMPTNNGRIHVP